MSLREYPKVWSRFERQVEDDILKFEIEDIPEAMWSTAVEFMLGNYIKEDVWWATAGTARDLEAVQEYRLLLTSIIKQKMSLACFLAEGDGSGHTLVGVNMCLPQEKGRFVEHKPAGTGNAFTCAIYNRVMSLREYPKVWSRFERQVEDDILKFEIEDIPEAMWSTAVEFMLGNYIKEDVWWATAGTARDLEAVQEYRLLLTSIIKQKMSLACFLAEGDGSGHTLVGVNMCLPQEKGRFVEHKPPKTKAGLLSLQMFAEAMKVTAIYDKYNVNTYLMGSGLSVAPEYRRLGIAVELLKQRTRLSKELGYRATGGIFTSAPSQRSAEKAGFECLYLIPYKQFGKQCKIKFDTKTEYLKIMAISTD